MNPLHPYLARPLHALSQAWEGIEIMGEAAAVDQIIATLPPEQVPDWLPPILSRILHASTHQELEACRLEIAERLAAGA